MEYIYKPPPPPPPKSEKNSRNRQSRLQPYSLPSRSTTGGIKNEANYADEESNITPQVDLDQAADAEKWIAERRKNWPSAKRVAEKEQEKERLKKLRQEAEKRVNNRVAAGTTTTEKKKKPICKFWLKGKCHNGNKCRYSHENQQHSNRKLKRYGPPEKQSLFKRLVQNDMNKENELVLDFVEYLHTKGLL